MNLHHPSFLYYTSVQLRAFSAHKIERCSTAADSIRQRAQAAQAQRRQADFALVAVSGRTSGSVAESPLPHKMVCQRCQARRAACSACYREHLPGASASPPRTRFLIFLRSGQDFLCLPLQRTIHFVKEPPSTGAAPPISARRLKRSAFDKVIKSAAKESSARLPNLPKTEKGGGALCRPNHLFKTAVMQSSAWERTQIRHSRAIWVMSVFPWPFRKTPADRLKALIGLETQPGTLLCPNHRIAPTVGI